MRIRPMIRCSGSRARLAMRLWMVLLSAVVSGAVAHAQAKPAASNPHAFRSFVTAGGWVCLVDKQRDLQCWLHGAKGGLSPEHRDLVPTFDKVRGLSNVVGVDGKENYLCSLDARGAVDCWGCPLGDGTCRLYPVRISLSGKARDLAVGVDGGCALLETSEVECWGSHVRPAVESKALGRRVFQEALLVPSLHDIVQLSASALGRCALDRTGHVRCWGDCVSEDCSALQAKPVALPAQVTAISSNRSYHCAISGPEREVSCWGLPDAEGTDWASSLPRSRAALERVVKIAPLRKIKQLAMGERFGVAVSDAGEVFHWGVSHHGGIRHFGREVSTYFSDKELELEVDAEPFPREDGRVMRTLRALDLEVQRVAERTRVRGVVVAGYYTCLLPEAGGTLCEWNLAHTPFRIAEVWPDVRFDEGVYK